VAPAPAASTDAAAAPDSSPAPARASLSIQVARPQARPGLDTERIALLQPGHRGDFYAGSQWPGALPDVVESLIVDRLRAARHWPVVEGSRRAFPAEYLLQVRIARFEASTATEGAAPGVAVTLQCILGDRTDRKVLSEFTVEGSAQADANRMGAVVAAFEKATNAALDQLEMQAWSAVSTQPKKSQAR